MPQCAVALPSCRPLTACPACSLKPPNVLVADEDGSFQQPGAIWLGDLGACTHLHADGLLRMTSPW